MPIVHFGAAAVQQKLSVASTRTRHPYRRRNTRMRCRLLPLGPIHPRRPDGDGRHRHPAGIQRYSATRPPPARRNGRRAASRQGPTHHRNPPGKPRHSHSARPRTRRSRASPRTCSTPRSATYPSIGVGRHICVQAQNRRYAPSPPEQKARRWIAIAAMHYRMLVNRVASPATSAAGLCFVRRQPLGSRQIAVSGTELISSSFDGSVQ